MTIDLFVFDIAGTTVRDDGVVFGAFRRTMASHGLVADDAWIKWRMGWDKVRVFGEALSMNGKDPSAAPALADRFTAEIRLSMDASPPVPLPGASSAIRSLRERGVRIAFNTGYSTPLALEIVSRMGWEPDAVVGSDLVAQGRPAPDMIRLAMARTGVSDPARVGVAGDTPSDLAAGTAAGCRYVVGVGHGTHTLAELAAHPHTHLVADLTTLAELTRD